MKSNQKRNDLIELFIVISFIIMIFTIYVPVGIWEEEQNFRKNSRFRMKNIYGIELFFEQLTGKYESDGLWAMNVVNAIRDSVTADSTYVGLQTLSLYDKDIQVDIHKTYDIEFDTTFGFLKMRRDTILDTIATVVVYSEELSRNDTIFTQNKKLNDFITDPSFRSILKKEPSQRVESIEYYDTYMPDSSMFRCPVTSDSYSITVEESSLRIASPITKVYKEPRFVLFSFKAFNHGYIDDGIKSWD